MRAFPAQWCVAGGWALDLFLGRQTRPHSDLELAIFRQDQALLYEHLRGWTFEKVVDGRRLAWSPDEERLALPTHEVHATSPDEPRRSIEFLLNERQEDHWVFRRCDHIRLPLARAVLHTDLGLPVLSPLIVVLFKAKAPREKDQRDFHSVLGTLKTEDREWLRVALHHCHPGHPWSSELEPPSR